MSKKTNADWARLQTENHGRDRYPTVESQFIKICEEQGELAKELNRWPDHTSIERIAGECADIALSLYKLCDKLDINLDEEIKWKVKHDDRKFS